MFSMGLLLHPCYTVSLLLPPIKNTSRSYECLENVNESLHSSSKKWVLSNMFQSTQRQVSWNLFRSPPEPWKKKPLTFHKILLGFLRDLYFMSLWNKPYITGLESSSPINPLNNHIGLFSSLTYSQGNEFGTKDESECKRKACLHRSPLTHLRCMGASYMVTFQGGECCGTEEDDLLGG